MKRFLLVVLLASRVILAAQKSTLKTEATKHADAITEKVIFDYMVLKAKK